MRAEPAIIRAAEATLVIKGPELVALEPVVLHALHPAPEFSAVEADISTISLGFAHSNIRSVPDKVAA